MCARFLVFPPPVSPPGVLVVRARALGVCIRLCVCAGVLHLKLPPSFVPRVSLFSCVQELFSLSRELCPRLPASKRRVSAEQRSMGGSVACSPIEGGVAGGCPGCASVVLLTTCCQARNLSGACSMACSLRGVRARLTCRRASSLASPRYRLRADGRGRSSSSSCLRVAYVVGGGRVRGVFVRSSSNRFAHLLTLGDQPKGVRACRTTALRG